MGAAGADKDFYARGTYKIGGLGELGGTAGQASATSAFYQDNSATLGGYVYSGTVGGPPVEVLPGVFESTPYSLREHLNVYAGTADLWYKSGILNATVMNMTSKIEGLPDRKSMAWYAQGQYVIYPWLIGLARYESTIEDTDLPSSDPASKPVTTLVPALVSMVRANVKVTLEYRRPMSDYAVRKLTDEHLLLRLNFAL